MSVTFQPWALLAPGPVVKPGFDVLHSIPVPPVDPIANTLRHFFASLETRLGLVPTVFATEELSDQVSYNL